MTKHARSPRRLGLPMALLAAGAAAVAAAPPASATLPPVIGGAYGYYAKISLFGGPPAAKGPYVKVKLPVGGSATPITKSAPSGSVVYGPATVFSSGPIAVSTQGTNGSATASASLQSPGSSPFTANSIRSVCNSKGVAPSGATTVSNGVVVTSTDANQNPTSTKAVPASPSVDFTINGTFKLSATDTESFKWVFNEQVKNPNGSLTVNAAHEILEGPTGVGDLIVGQAACRD